MREPFANCEADAELIYTRPSKRAAFPRYQAGSRTVRWQRSVVIEAIRKEISEAQKLSTEREAAMSAYSQRGVAKRRANRQAAQQESRALIEGANHG